MTYNDFVAGINSGKITRIDFFVKNYNHYRKCCIKSHSDIVNFKGNQIEIPTTECKLTADNSEVTNFMRKFNEDCKLFKINGVKYTLKQIWDKIEITEIFP